MWLRIGTLGACLLWSASWCSAQNTETSALAEQQVLLRQKCAELDRLALEIAQLRSATGTAQQISVNVQILEIALTKLRQLGVDAQWFPGEGNDGREIRRLSAAQIGAPLAESLVDVDSKLSQRYIDALKQQGLAKVLAQSTLVVVSGQPAWVHVGGEFAIPTEGDSNSPVEFKRFGTELRVAALTLGANQVRLDVGTEVSSVDDSRAVEIHGARIPGIRSCSCENRVEMELGQSAVLNGLVQKRTESRQLKNGQVAAEVVDVGLMIVITPMLAGQIDKSADNARNSAEPTQSDIRR
ncbi:MAG: hypothetical protein U0795_09445 [Pirellulales bacterium]